MKCVATVIGAIAMTAATLGVASAQSDRPIQAGTLECDVSAGIGLIIGSNRELSCVFVSAQGPQEAYVGSIRKFGLDIGATAGGRMAWAVYAPTNRAAWALAGTYAGASAEATVGAGLGANVLIGGSNRTVSLQPLSIQGQTGLNVAAGVADLTLRPAR